MNEMQERIKNDLLMLINEGKNLSDGFVEIKPGIRIKAGREREFTRLCDNYYEMTFSEPIGRDTDTITPVYEALTQNLEAELEETYSTIGANYNNEVQGEIARFKNLVKSYNTVNNAYGMTSRNLSDLYLKRENTEEWRNKVNELNAEADRLANNINILMEQMKVARKNVNETMIKYALQEMERIRNKFINASRIRNFDQASTIDQNIVIASDKEEYDNLYRLVLILRHANEIDDIVNFTVVDGTVIVNDDQKDILVSSILPNIKFYEYLKAPEQKENISSSPKDINNIFIENIKDALTALKNRDFRDIYTIPDNEVERNLYMEMLRIVNRANNSNFTLVPVWNQVYVLGEDREKMLDLMNKSKGLQKLNPDYAKREENNKLIEDLYAYLDEMANKVIRYKGVTNLPIQSTNTVDDKAWVVIDTDWKEANRIVEIIKLLKAQNNNLLPVWGIANINKDDIPRFKKLASATKRFQDVIPVIEENEAEIQNVHEELKRLLRKAVENPNAKLASDGLFLEEDSEISKLLNEKYGYLESAKVSNNLIPVDGVLIDGNYVSKYQELNKKINDLLNGRKEESTIVPESIPEPAVSKRTDIDFSLNDADIKTLERYVKTLEDIPVRNELEEELYLLAKEAIEILTRAKSSDNIIEFNGFKFASEADKERYSTLVDRIREITIKLNTPVNESYGKKGEPTIVPEPMPESIPEPVGSRRTDIDFSLNDKSIAVLKENIKTVIAISNPNELEKELFVLSNEAIEILARAKSSNNIIDYKGLKFAGEDDKERLIAINKRVNEIIDELEKSESDTYEPIPLNKSLVPYYGLNNNDSISNTKDFTNNDKEIERLTARLNELKAKTSQNEQERKEFDIISSQIEILENAKNSDNIIESNNLKFASSSDANAYRELANLEENSQLENEEDDLIDFTVNDKVIATLKERLEELKAKDNQDEETLKAISLINELIETLERAKNSENPFIDRSGLVFANLNDSDHYLDTDSKLAEIMAKGKDSDTLDLSANEKKIAELKEEMAGLEPVIKDNETANKIYKLLEEQIEVLSNAKDSENPVVMDSLKFASEDDKEKYLKAQMSLDEIKEELEDSNKKTKKKGKFRKKILGIRDMFTNNRITKAIKEHKAAIRIIIGLGLGLVAISAFLPQIAPAVAFASSCNATAFPALSGLFNGISNTLINVFNVSELAKLGASANLALEYSVSALSKLGIVGIGTGLAFKNLGSVMKKYNEMHDESVLVTENVRRSEDKENAILKKLKELIEKLKEQVLAGVIDLNRRTDNLYDKIKNAKKKEEETPVLEDLPEAPVLEETKSDPAVEAKAKLGEEILKRQAKAREELQEKLKGFDEAKALEKAEKEKAQKEAKKTTAPVAPVVPKVEVPSPDEIMSSLDHASTPAVEPVKLSKEEIESVFGPTNTEESSRTITPAEATLNGEEQEPETLDVVPDPKSVKTERMEQLLRKEPDKARTAEALNTIVSAPMEPSVDDGVDLSHLDQRDLEYLEAIKQHVREYQGYLDVTPDDGRNQTIRKAYQDEIDRSLAQIERMEKKGKRI